MNNRQDKLIAATAGLISAGYFLASWINVLCTQGGGMAAGWNLFSLLCRLM